MKDNKEESCRFLLFSNICIYIYIHTYIFGGSQANTCSGATSIRQHADGPQFPCLGKEDLVAFVRSPINKLQRKKVHIRLRSFVLRV